MTIKNGQQHRPNRTGGITNKDPNAEKEIHANKLLSE